MAENHAGFRKTRAGAPAEYFEWEALGLRWLASAADGPPIPEVLEVSAAALVIQRLHSTRPTRESAVAFGRRLALLHGTPVTDYGCPPPGWESDSGFIADLTLPVGSWPDFGSFYAEARIEPYLRMLADGGTDSAQLSVFGAVMTRLHDDPAGIGGPPEAAALLHGDLWSGNVMWCSDVSAPAADAGGLAGADDLAPDEPTVWLIDPAAHGGHRETDLAMLALFGCPELPAILDAYDATTPLADGWRQRVALHQIHPLLVHAVLFGGGYLAQAQATAKAALRNT